MGSMGLAPEVVGRLSVLWGKSAARNGGRTHLLLGHLLDTAAVAEVMWGEYLAPSLRRRLDEVSGGRGREWFMWVCGIHDCGKATPAFQSLDSVEAGPVVAAGLTWGRWPKSKRWRHDVAGGALLAPLLREAWGREAAGWVWPLVAGHHGAFPSAGSLKAPVELQGRGEGWLGVQRSLVDVFTRAVGFEGLGAVCPVGGLRRAEQLALSGLVVMADWIASDSSCFEGLGEIGEVSLAGARRRAVAGWSKLGLRGGWGVLGVPGSAVDPLVRFGVVPRASQVDLVERVWGMPVPGLVVVEAPMGEGKTKGALAVAEVLAARFGLDGVFVAMPTQATSDPMFAQVVSWVESFDPVLVDQVALLHGKRRFNAQWRKLWEGYAGAGGQECAAGDEYGAVDEDDEFGWEADSCGAAEREGPVRWFLESRRGLLTGFAVGTVDHLLYAATRTRHVMLRFAGLAGKVVIVDEVHAADVYMRQFLVEALRWLGQAGVPVVLLSATLPPVVRQTLVDAYLSGVTGRVDGVEVVPEPAGYPSVTSAYAMDGRVVVESSTEAVPSWRASVRVGVEWLPDVSVEGVAVADAVREAVADGGVALVVVNQVDRAQSVYKALVAGGFDGELVLLHGRLCAADRAERTERCLRLMGPEAGAERPGRMVVVATQLAEQSFDVDADVLVTDLAPADLLLQRVGRLHRHEGTRRPAGLAVPRVLVTGVAGGGSGLPVFLPASKAIYGEWALLRAAALVAEAAGALPPVPDADAGEDGGPGSGPGWSIPEQVPGVVARAYGESGVCPAPWDVRERAAEQVWLEKQAKRAAKAQDFVLTRPREWASETLAGLHYGGAHGVRGEEELDALVRDGERSVEVVVVRRVRGGYAALGGGRLGAHGEVGEAEVLERVLGGLVRLPLKLTEVAEEELRALPGWAVDPWLRYARALVLEEDGWAVLGPFRVGYDEVLGLVVEEMQTPAVAGTTSTSRQEHPCCAGRPEAVGDRTGFSWRQRV
ncbi:CRISPR-associated helicase Cas3' [Streptomyces sp. CAU 1734]|uniref:CRISPR-associated helicase Cas3' n=1 Tax=Streptomyces sp. CAU 1734 TaxID=3140360 RepID=UPI0032610FD9